MKFTWFHGLQAKFATLVAVMIIVFVFGELYVINGPSSTELFHSQGDLDSYIRAQAQHVSPPSDQSQRISQLFYGFHGTAVHTRMPHHNVADTVPASSEKFSSLVSWGTKRSIKNVKFAMVIGLQQLPKTFLVRALNEMAGYASVPALIADTKADKRFKSLLNSLNADIWRSSVSQTLSSTKYSKTDNDYLWLRSLLSDTVVQTKLQSKGFEDENLLIWSLFSLSRLNLTDKPDLLTRARALVETAVSIRQEVQDAGNALSFLGGDIRIAFRDTFIPLTLPIWLQALSQTDSVVCYLMYRDPYQLYSSIDMETIKSIFGSASLNGFGDIRRAVSSAWKNVIDSTVTSCGNAGRPVVLIHQDMLFEGGSLSLTQLSSAIAKLGLEDTRTALMPLIESMAKLKKSYPFMKSSKWKLAPSEDLLFSSIEHLKCDGSYDKCKIGGGNRSSRAKSINSKYYGQSELVFYIFSHCESDYCCLSDFQLSTIETIFFHYSHASLVLYVNNAKNDIKHLNGLAPLANLGYKIQTVSYIQFYLDVKKHYPDFLQCVASSDPGSLIFKLMNALLNGGVNIDLGTAILRAFPPTSSFLSYVSTYGPSIAVLKINQANDLDLLDVVAKHCFSYGSTEESLMKEMIASKVVPVLPAGYLSLTMSTIKSVLTETFESSQRIYSFRLPVVNKQIDRLSRLDAILVANGVGQGIDRFKEYASLFLGPAVKNSNTSDENNVIMDTVQNGSFLHLFPDLIQGVKLIGVSYLEDFLSKICIICNKWREDSSACSVPDTSEVVKSTLLSREFRLNPDKYFYIWTTEASSFQNWRPRFLESIFLHHPHASVEVFSNALTSSYFTQFSAFDLKVTNFDIPALFKDTPLEALLPKMAFFETGRFFYSHITDALRLVLLWRYGGTYLDSDIVILKNLDALGTFAGNQGPPSYAVNGALLRFPKYHPILLLAMEEYTRRYLIPCGAGKCYSNDWIMVGPSLITWVATSFAHITTIVDKTTYPSQVSASKFAFNDHRSKRHHVTLPKTSTTSTRTVQVRQLGEFDTDGPSNEYSAGLRLTIYPPEAFYPVPWNSATKNQLTLVGPANSFDFDSFSNSMAFHMWNKLNALNGVTPFSFMDTLLQQHGVFPRRPDLMTLNDWKIRSFERLTVIFLTKERAGWIPSYMSKLINAYPGAAILGVMTFAKIQTARRVPLSVAFNNAESARNVLSLCEAEDHKFSFMAQAVSSKSSVCASMVLSPSSDPLSMLKDAMEFAVNTDYVLFLERGTTFRTSIDLTVLLSFLHEENDFEVVIPAVSIDKHEDSSNSIIDPELYAFAAEDGSRRLSDSTLESTYAPPAACACKLNNPEAGLTGVHYGRGSVYLFRSSLLEGVTLLKGQQPLYSNWREELFRRVFAVGGRSVYVNAISVVTEDATEVGPLLRFDECKTISCHNPLLPTELHNIVLHPPAAVLIKEFYMTAVTVVDKELVSNIDEWIEYHLLQGFDHIVVYDMSDGYFDSYPSSQVTVVDVSFLLISMINEKEQGSSDYSFRDVVSICFTHAHKLVSDRSDWIAFLNANEYVQTISNQGSDNAFRDFVTSMNRHSAIMLQMDVFCGIYDVNTGSSNLIIEKYNRRISDTWIPPATVALTVFSESRLIVKSDMYIVLDGEPNKLALFSPNYKYTNSNLPVNDIGIRQWPSVKSYTAPTVARVNKYFSETSKMLNERSVSDPTLFRAIRGLIDTDQSTYKEMCSQEDDSMQVWSEKLKERLKNRGNHA